MANSAGGIATFRIALGSLDGSKHATLGQMTRFDDNSGVSQRVQGSLMKQDPTAFTNLAVGTYVFGYHGVQSAGARLAVVGLYHADGAGNLTNFNADAIDGQGNSSKLSGRKPRTGSMIVPDYLRPAAINGEIVRA